jgi:hypothetical protein
VKSRSGLKGIFLLLAALIAPGACNIASFYSTLGNKAQLLVSPAAASVPANGSVTFSASGGAPPYVFSVTSGSGSIGASTGVYTATTTPGAAIVQVKDSQGSVATAVVNPVAYAVTNVSRTGGTLYATGAVNGNFTFKNPGTSNGTQTVSWTVYASPTSTLGAGNVVVASGTTAPLNGGATSSPIAFSGSWPATPGSYYLIASLSSSDSAGASGPTASASTIAAAVDYAVAAVNFSSVATTTFGGAVSGTFQIQNNGPNGGTQPVTWQVYANTTPTTGGTPVFLASGSTPALAAGNLSPVLAFSGTWPSTAGYYYLVVSVSVLVDQDLNPANNVMAVFDAALTDPANDVFATATSMGITLAPLMSIQVTGSLTATNLNDFLSFNAGATNNVQFSVTWTTSASVTLNVLAPGPSTIATASATGTSLSTLWSSSASAGLLRYVQLNNTSGAPGVYVMTITVLN